MEDQLIALKEKDIEATMLSASLPPKEVTAIQNQLIEKNCTLKIIYVTPEKLAKSKRFMAKLEKAYASKSVFCQEQTVKFLCNDNLSEKFHCLVPYYERTIS